jgi:hypothetical protein
LNKPKHCWADKVASDEYQWGQGSLTEAEATSVKVRASERHNLYIYDPQGAFNYSCDMKVPDCIQNGSSFSMLGS